MATEWSSLDEMIAEAAEMQASGKYLNGRVFHSIVGELTLLRAENARLRGALERLGSMEAFVVSRRITNGCDELIARIDFARTNAATDQLRSAVASEREAPNA